MKKLLLLLVLFPLIAMAQTFNNYKYVIIPVKFPFLKTENQYRLNTIAKMELNALGFITFYDNEMIPEGIDKDRCNFLYATVESESGMLTTKLFVTFKDCQNKLLYKSDLGVSREKDFAAAYQQALKRAIATIGYSYEPVQAVPKTAAATPKVETHQPVAAPAKPVPVTGKLKAEAVSSGYLLVDETSSVIALRLTKTSDPNIFLAQRQNLQGVLIQKEGNWFFEYYQNGALVSEKIDVVF